MSSANAVAALPPPALELRRHLEMAGAYETIVHETEDHREALAAVFEKRSPTFRYRWRA